MTKNVFQTFAAFEESYSIHQDLPPVVIRDASCPVVSIVTPSYNQGRFIRETIVSILNQDYPNIEYWVIDGGSSDETFSILKEYEIDPRFHWISEKDKGQSDAINKGLARCRGEIFNWVCSDDLLLPGALRHAVDAWVSSHQPTAIYGWGRQIDQDGNDLGYGPRQSSKVELTKVLRSECFPIQPATFVPTFLVRSVGGVDTSLDYAMDLDLWIKLMERVPFKHIPFDLALFRIHQSSKSVAASVRFIDDVTRVLEGAADRNLLSKSKAISYAGLFAAQIYLTPEVRDFRRALDKLRSSITASPPVFFAALFILLKGMMRLSLGEKLWSKVRFAQVRFR